MRLHRAPSKCCCYVKAFVMHIRNRIKYFQPHVSKAPLSFAPGSLEQNDTLLFLLFLLVILCELFSFVSLLL